MNRHFPGIAALLPLVLAAGCGSGSSPPSSAVAPSCLGGPWYVDGQIEGLEVGAIASIGLEDTDLTLHPIDRANTNDQDIFEVSSAVLTMPRLAVGAASSPGADERFFLGGIYYDPLLDITVEFGGDTPVVDCANFDLVFGFEVYEGDVMVEAQLSPEVSDWSIAPGAVLLARGTYRLLGSHL